MTTPENPNPIKNNLENTEAPKMTPENLEPKEISNEELLDYSKNEEVAFKNETTEEMEKSNSVNLDEETFEKVKNETGVEQELAEIDKEAETAIAESQQEINQDTKTPEEIAYNQKYEERLMGSLVALTGGEFEKEFGHGATIDEKGYIIKADGTNTMKMPSMLDYHAEVKKNGDMSPDELRKNTKEEMEWEKKGKSEKENESGELEKSETEEEQKIEDLELEQENQTEQLNEDVETKQEKITHLTESIVAMESVIDNTAEESNSEFKKEDPNVFKEKYKFRKLELEKEALEKLKAELIQEEKEKILQEKLDGIFKEFEGLNSQDFQSILKSGKTAEGRSVESKSMGSLNPETAQSLAKVFAEGIKSLSKILESLPEFLKKLDEEATKEATENVEKKLEEEKEKVEEEQENKEKIEEPKLEEKSETLENEIPSDEVNPEQKPVEGEDSTTSKVNNT